MSRIYRVTFEKVSTTAVQDLLAIRGSTGKVCRIKRRWFSETTVALATAQMFAFRERIMPATLTITGGTSLTATPLDPGDATAASFTATSNNTTKTTSSGTPLVINEDSCHSYNGFNDMFVDNLPVFGLNQAYVLELLNTPSGTVILSGGAEIEEIGL
jgi:hypothetical protein